jgi:rhodanese-related sulfurtransferase
MMRFDSRIGAGLLVGLAAVYMVASVATGRSARAEVPPDLTPPAGYLALDVWKAANVVVQEPGTALIDVRPAEAYARYHLPGAVNLPGAGPEEVRGALRGAPAAIVYAGKDDVAQTLVAAARASDAAARVHYLVDGARAWYLAFELPVPLFSDAPPPSGYAEALATVKAWLEERDPAAQGSAAAALQALVRAGYQPNLLQGARKPAAIGGGKKKLSGGCG